MYCGGIKSITVITSSHEDFGLTVDALSVESSDKTISHERLFFKTTNYNFCYESQLFFSVRTCNFQVFPSRIQRAVTGACLACIGCSFGYECVHTISDFRDITDRFVIFC